MKLKYGTSQRIAGSDSGIDNSIDDIYLYYVELEKLLRHVESSQTYYQALNLDQLATLQQIRHAYEQSLNLLFPPYHLFSEIPRGTLARIERAFEKTSRAFSVLALRHKRQEYDDVLFGHNRWTYHPAGKQLQPLTQSVRKESPTTSRISSTVDSQQKVLPSIPEASKPKVIDKGINRRRAERIRMTISVRVQGHDRKNGKWDEKAETVDVSRTGATIRLRRKMRHGLIVYLTLPMPDKLRCHGFGVPGYNVYALVRRVERAKGGVRIVGVEFLGEQPPKGYMENPWATFRTTGWSGIDRRRKMRDRREEAISIEFFNEMAQSVGKFMATTEDISQTGVRLCVRQAPTEFELVRVTFTGRGFESFATLQNRYLGNDGFERLCLAFLGSELPE